MLFALAGLYFIGEKLKNSPTTDAASGIGGFPATRAPKVSGAFAVGGIPQATGPVRTLFKEALPAFVIALDAWSRSGMGHLPQARAALMKAARHAALPAKLLASLEALIDASLDAAQSEEKNIHTAADFVARTTLALNEQIATVGLGFFIDSEILGHTDGKRSVLLFSFEVLRVVLYRSNGHDVRTLRIRRLDDLNWTYSLLGFTSPERRDAVVLDNKVDEHLLRLLPALAQDMKMDLFSLSPQDSQTPWFQELHKRACKSIKDELGQADSPELTHLATLVARRQEIYQSWNEQLKARRMHIDPPSSLAVTWKYRAQMAGLVSNAALDELDKIQEQLAQAGMLQAYAEVHDHFAQSVERHEAQHRLDLGKLYTLPMPPELAEYVGSLPEGFSGQASLAGSALAETSAYLSELARDPLTPKLNLMLLARYLLNPKLWGSGESYAALVIIAGLAKELKLEHKNFVSHQRIEREAVAGVLTQLSEVDTPRLQSAAAALWQRLFARPIPRLELVAR